MNIHTCIHTHITYCSSQTLPQKWKCTHNLPVQCNIWRGTMHFSNQRKIWRQLYPLLNLVALINLTEKIKERKQTNSPAHRIVLLRENSCSSLLFSVMNERKDGNPPEKHSWNTELMTNFLVIAKTYILIHIYIKYRFIFISL